MTAGWFVSAVQWSPLAWFPLARSLAQSSLVILHTETVWTWFPHHWWSSRQEEKSASGKRSWSPLRQVSGWIPLGNQDGVLRCNSGRQRFTEDNHNMFMSCLILSFRVHLGKLVQHSISCKW